MEQVIFKIDKKLKDRAMEKAKAEGIPLGYILKLATKAYVEGNLYLSIVSTKPIPAPNTKTRESRI